MVAATLGPPRTVRRLLPLALVFVAVGLSTSFVSPYLALFLSEEVDAGPIRTTAFLIAAPLSGVIVSSLVGRLSDRRPIRRTLLIVASLAGVAATTLTAVVRDYWVLLALTITLTALAQSLFPQSFAYAREVLRRGDPARAAMGISVLRTIFSVAWVGGPPIAALILADKGFWATYALAAVLYAIGAVVVIVALREVDSPAAAGDTPEPEAVPETAPRRTIVLIIAGFTVAQVSMTLGIQAMPQFASNDLGGSVRTAGLILGLCAALEIPLMLMFGVLTTRFATGRLILLGVVLGVVYQAVATAATEAWMLASVQILNAAFIATVTGLGISYVQDLMPDRPGRATTMVTNTFPAGQILAAPAFGLAQLYGFRLAYGINLFLCLMALVLLLLAGRRDAGKPKAGRPEAGASAVVISES